LKIIDLGNRAATGESETIDLRKLLPTEETTFDSTFTKALFEKARLLSKEELQVHGSSRPTISKKALQEFVKSMLCDLNPQSAVVSQNEFFCFFLFLFIRFAAGQANYR
jgi:hypothetical protein